MQVIIADGEVSAARALRAAADSIESTPLPSVCPCIG
jgi:hypothetical protein